MSDSSLRLLVSGFYGGFNLGDEALLAGLLTLIGRHLPQAEVTVLSGNPSHTAAMHRVRSLSRALHRDVLARAGALRRSDLLIIGGGGLLQDVAGRQGARGTLGRTLSLAAWAHRAQVPVAYWGIGVGPLSPPALSSVQRALSRATLVAVRDRSSQELCRSIGVESELVPDHAWALELPPVRGGTRIGVSLRRWPGLDLTLFSQMLATIVRKENAPALFLPFEDDDCVVGRQLADLMGGGIEVPDRPEDLKNLLALYAQCRGVVAMRLHSGLLAALQGIPSVGIAYDRKVDELHRELGDAGRCLPLADAPDAPRVLSEWQAAHPELPDLLLAHTAQRHEAANRSAASILQGMSRRG